MFTTNPPAPMYDINPGIPSFLPASEIYMIWHGMDYYRAVQWKYIFSIEPERTKIMLRPKSYFSTEHFHLFLYFHQPNINNDGICFFHDFHNITICYSISTPGIILIYLTCHELLLVIYDHIKCAIRAVVLSGFSVWFPYSRVCN